MRKLLSLTVLRNDARWTAASHFTIASFFSSLCGHTNDINAKCTRKTDTTVTKAAAARTFSTISAKWSASSRLRWICSRSSCPWDSPIQLQAIYSIQWQTETSHTSCSLSYEAMSFSLRCIWNNATVNMNMLKWDFAQPSAANSYPSCVRAMSLLSWSKNVVRVSISDWRRRLQPSKNRLAPQIPLPPPVIIYSHQHSTPWNISMEGLQCRNTFTTIIPCRIDNGPTINGWNLLDLLALWITRTSRAALDCKKTGTRDPLNAYSPGTEPGASATMALPAPAFVLSLASNSSKRYRVRSNLQPSHLSDEVLWEAGKRTGGLGDFQLLMVA